jgi:hypothetical protein
VVVENEGAMCLLFACFYARVVAGVEELVPALSPPQSPGRANEFSGLSKRLVEAWEQKKHIPGLPEGHWGLLGNIHEISPAECVNRLNQMFMLAVNKYSFYTLQQTLFPNRKRKRKKQVAVTH